jgi:hypothetical protein
MRYRENVTLCIGLTVGVRMGVCVCGDRIYPAGMVTKMYTDMSKQIQHTTHLNKHQQYGYDGNADAICTMCLLYYIYISLYISLLKKSTFIGHYSVLFPYTEETTLYITHELKLFYSLYQRKWTMHEIQQITGLITPLLTPKITLNFSNCDNLKNICHLRLQILIGGSTKIMVLLDVMPYRLVHRYQVFKLFTLLP